MKAHNIRWILASCLLVLAPTVFSNASQKLANQLVDTPHTLSNIDVNQLSGTLAVVNKSDNSISIIDVASKQIIKTLPTGQGPHELVLSNNKKWAVSTDFVGGDSLTVFDVETQKVARTIALPKLAGPHGIRFLKDNVHVVFTSGKTQQLGMVNVEAGEVVNSIATAQNSTHMVALNQNETRAYTTNIRSNTISVLDLETGSKLKDISTADMPEAINYAHTSNELWYGTNKEGLVFVIEPESEKVLARWDGFSFPYRVLFNHDESVAIVPDFRNHNVRFFDTRTKQELGTLTLEDNAGPQGITLHPELDIAFLSLNLKNKIIAIDIHTRKVLGEFPTGNNPDGVVYIP